MAPPDAEATLRALVIDDNRALAENISEVLRDEGYAARVVTHPRDALEAARREGFDIGFLDVRLPETMGTDLLVQLKEICPHAEVIVMSGDATLESAVASVRGGAFAYILKPVAMEEMLRIAGLATRQVLLRREREALIAQLRHSEQRYRTVVEMSPSLIVGLDAEGTIALVNAAVESTTGYTREALLGQGAETLALPAEWPEADEPEERSVSTPDGGERRIEWRYGATDEMNFAVGIDVTEARAIERRVRAAEQLAVVGELTAGLAHEIRNPLNSALLELKVLVRRLTRAKDEQGVASAEAVRGELERLERLLADFLWFARPRSRQAQVGDLQSPAETVARVVASEAAERNIVLTTEFAPNTPRVSFDEDRIRQVVFNLVRNAMEAMDRDGHIVIRTRANHHHAELQIEDDGPGIKGDPERIFMPFHTTKATGTGLGLTIARRIATDHGGDLRVESEPGCTIFTLSLPRAEELPTP